MGAGEGSRGGKVVGHSRSGRPIYAAEATAKAAMGHDPHPGVRQATPHAPVLPGGGLGANYSLSPKQKAESATIGAQAATQKAVAHNDYASNRDASNAHAQASDAHTAAAKAAQQLAGPNAKGSGKHEAMSLAHLHAAQAHALAGNKHPTARGGHVAAAEAFKNAGDFKSAGEHQKAAIAQGGPLPPELARADGRGEKLRPRGNLDRPAVLNKPGYRGR